MPYIRFVGRISAMETLELLIRQFEEGAKEFPGMTHVVMKWPKGSPEPKLPKGLPKHCQLAYDKDNLCKVHFVPPDDYRGVIDFSRDPSETAKIEVNISHWTIRPQNKSWDKEAAIRKLKILSEKAGRLYEKLKRPIIPTSQDFVDFTKSMCLSERWLLALHELT